MRIHCSSACGAGRCHACAAATADCLMIYIRPTQVKLHPTALAVKGEGGQRAMRLIALLWRVGTKGLRAGAKGGRGGGCQPTILSLTLSSAQAVTSVQVLLNPALRSGDPMTNKGVCSHAVLVVWHTSSMTTEHNKNQPGLVHHVLCDTSRNSLPITSCPMSHFC